MVNPVLCGRFLPPCTDGSASTATGELPWAVMSTLAWRPVVREYLGRFGEHRATRQHSTDNNGQGIVGIGFGLVRYETRIGVLRFIVKRTTPAQTRERPKTAWLGRASTGIRRPPLRWMAHCRRMDRAQATVQIDRPDCGRDACQNRLVQWDPSEYTSAKACSHSGHITTPVPPWVRGVRTSTSAKPSPTC